MEVSNANVLKTALEDLGRKPAEVSAYQTALLLGPRPASTIARASGVSRAHIYDVLNSLKEKGFVEELSRNKVKHFAPLPAEQVLSRLNSLAKRIDVNRRRLEDVLPNLLSVPIRVGGSPTIQFLQGSAGLERAWEESLRATNTEVLEFLDQQQSLLAEHTPRTKWFRSLLRQKNSQNVSIRILCVVSTLKQNCLPLDALASPTARRTLADIHFGSDILIFGSRVAILSRLPSPRGVLLESEAFAAGFRAVHQLAWTSACTDDRSGCSK